jgi:hypothetical protein
MDLWWPRGRHHATGCVAVTPAPAADCGSAGVFGDDVRERAVHTKRQQVIRSMDHDLAAAGTASAAPMPTMSASASRCS